MMELGRCCHGRSDKTGGIPVSVILRRADIRHDVNFTSWKVARCRIGGVQSKSLSITDEEAATLLQRFLVTAVGEIRAALQRYIRLPLPRVADDSLRTERCERPQESDGYDIDTTSREVTTIFPEEYVLELLMPDDWRGDAHTLALRAHGYVVSYILAEWFDIVKPDEAPTYRAKAEDLLGKISSEGFSSTVRVTFRL